MSKPCDPSGAAVKPYFAWKYPYLGLIRESALKIFFRALFVSALLMMSRTICFASNPIITYPYTADPSPHQWSDGKYYMYCSHDKDQPNNWDMEDYHVFSSSDLVTWTDHGVAFNKADSPFGNGAA